LLHTDGKVLCLALSLLLGEAYTPSIYRLNWSLNVVGGWLVGRRKLKKKGWWLV